MPNHKKNLTSETTIVIPKKSYECLGESRHRNVTEEG